MLPDSSLKGIGPFGGHGVEALFPFGHAGEAGTSEVKVVGTFPDGKSEGLIDQVEPAPKTY
jgi:hypothetical protein